MKNKRIYEKLMNVFKMLISLIIGGVSTYFLLEIKPPSSIFGLINILLLMIAGFYTTTFLHEIGHILGFKFNGFKTLLVAVGPIIYTNYLCKKVRFKSSNFILGGGMIPKVEKINSYQKIQQFSKAYKLSLVLGPVFNMITVFICIIYMITTQSIPVYLYFVMITSITTFFYSFIKAMEVKGDIYLLLENRNESNFVLPYLHKYSVLNNTSTEYLDNLMKDELHRILEKRHIGVDDATFLGDFIDYYSVNLNELPKFIDNFIDYWIDNYNLIDYKSSFEKQTLLVVFHKYLYNKICVKAEVEYYKNFYKNCIYKNDLKDNPQLEFYKDRSNFILKTHESKDYVKKIKNFHDIMILEYLLEKYDYIEKLIKTDF